MKVFQSVVLSAMLMLAVCIGKQRFPANKFNLEIVDGLSHVKKVTFHVRDCGTRATVHAATMIPTRLYMNTVTDVSFSFTITPDINIFYLMCWSTAHINGIRIKLHSNTVCRGDYSSMCLWPAGKTRTYGYNESWNIPYLFEGDYSWIAKCFNQDDILILCVDLSFSL